MSNRANEIRRLLKEHFKGSDVVIDLIDNYSRKKISDQDFLKEQIKGNFNINDFDLITVTLFLHRVCIFERLMGEMIKVLNKKGKFREQKKENDRQFLSRNSKEFAKAILLFEREEGPLWARDIIAHNEICYGLNIGAYQQVPGYYPVVDKTKEYLNKKFEKGEIKDIKTLRLPFKTIYRLSIEMFNIINIVAKDINDYIFINDRDEEEFNKAVKIYKIKVLI